jgi:hypothetical protein
MKSADDHVSRRRDAAAPAYAATLARALRSSDAQVRGNAALAASTIDKADVTGAMLDGLLGLLVDRDPRLRRLGAEALRALGFTRPNPSALPEVIAVASSIAASVLAWLSSIADQQHAMGEAGWSRWTVVAAVVAVAASLTAIVLLVARRAPSLRAARPALLCLVVAAGASVLFMVPASPPTAHLDASVFAIDRPSYGLFVGVTNFPRSSADPLPLSGSSAVQMEELFRRTRAMSRDDAMQTLIDAQATLSNVRVALRDLFRRALADHGSAQVVIYFCTHARNEAAGAEPIPYLLTHDSEDGHYVSTALSFHDLLGLIQEHGSDAYRILLIADVCHAGKLEAYLLSPRFADAAHRLAVVMASGPDSKAYALNALGSSVLAFEMIAGLHGAASPEGGNEITLEALGAYLARTVPQHCSQTPGLQLGRSDRWTEPVMTRFDGGPSRSRFGRLIVRSLDGTDVYLDGRAIGIVRDGTLVVEQAVPGNHVVRAVLPARPGTVLRRESEVALPVFADETAEVTFDDDRAEAVGVLSDALPVHEVLYRPVVYRPSSRASVHDDSTDRPFAGNVCTRVEIDLSDVEWNGVHWLPEGELGGTRGMNVASALAAREGERVLLRWRARSDVGASVQFKVGGVPATPFGDSMPFPKTTPYVTLNAEWTPYEIELSDQDLSMVLAAFCVVADRRHNPNETLVQFSIDEVRFVRVGPR